MKTVAVVPVKDLREAKTRLAPVLSPQQRSRLALDMLDRVLRALRRSESIDSIAVISPVPEQLELPIGITVLRQESQGLNELLEQGREWAIAEEADALMVAFADLPLLSPSEIGDIVSLGEYPNSLVLAPDRHMQGTNIMLAHPPSAARFDFGVESYPRHAAAALRSGLQLEVYSADGTSLDIDTPDDLEWLEMVGGIPSMVAETA